MLPRKNRVRKESDIKKLLRSRTRKNIGIVEIIALKASADRPKPISENNTEKSPHHQSGKTLSGFKPPDNHTNNNTKNKNNFHNVQNLNNFNKNTTANTADRLNSILKTDLGTNLKGVNTHLGKSENDGFQLVIIISKKIHKKATQRRLIKRRISFIFEDLRANNRLPKNVQMCILVKDKAILETSFSELSEKIKNGARDVYFYLNRPAGTTKKWSKESHQNTKKYNTRANAGKEQSPKPNQKSRQDLNHNSIQFKNQDKIQNRRQTQNQS